MRESPRRRSVLRTVGFGSVLALAGCAGTNQQSADTETDVQRERPATVPDASQTCTSLDGHERDPAELVPKDEAGYQLHPENGAKLCANCTYFCPGAGSGDLGACTRVEGGVRSSDYCVLYEPAERFHGDPTRSTRHYDPPVLEDRPAAVYYPTHVEEMEMIGAAQQGDRTVGMMATYPDRFWTVTGSRAERTTPDNAASIHLMVSVWDTTTKTVLPIASGVQVTVSERGETLDERTMWPMLSQPMGFHFGANIPFPRDTTYTITVDLGPISIDRGSAFSDRSWSAGTVELEYQYIRVEHGTLPTRRLDDRAGERGAVDPMEMDMMPLSVAPMPEDLPGSVLGTAESGDANFVVTAVDADSGTYLTVSPRTPYNRYVLPMMSLSMTLQSETKTLERSLRSTIDPERGYHYATLVDDFEQVSELTLTVDAPPQASRHEGYETAFIDMPPMTVPLD